MNHKALMTENVTGRARRAAIKIASEAIPGSHKARKAAERIRLRLGSQKFPALKLTFVTLVYSGLGHSFTLHPHFSIAV